MPSMTGPTTLYADRLKAHLASYKRSVLAVNEDGIWTRNGRSYPHILPMRHRTLNLLAPLREQLIAFLVQQQGFGYHRDFHHLNSSQAMCLNLMFPLVGSTAIADTLATLLRLDSPLDPHTAVFEYVPDAVEATNFDFFVRTAAGAQVFFEFKLTESEFGTATADTRHLRKLRDIYAPRLQHLVNPVALEPTTFFARYQLFRNLSALAAPSDLLALVLPRAHVRLAARARSFIADLPEPVQHRVRLVYMDDVAVAFHKAAVGGRLPSIEAQMDGFIGKYCID